MLQNGRKAGKASSGMTQGILQFGTLSTSVNASLFMWNTSTSPNGSCKCTFLKFVCVPLECPAFYVKRVNLRDLLQRILVHTYNLIRDNGENVN